MRPVACEGSEWGGGTSSHSVGIVNGYSYMPAKTREVRNGEAGAMRGALLRFLPRGWLFCPILQITEQDAAKRRRRKDAPTVVRHLPVFGPACHRRAGQGTLDGVFSSCLSRPDIICQRASCLSFSLCGRLV